MVIEDTGPDSGKCDARHGERLRQALAEVGGQFEICGKYCLPLYALRKDKVPVHIGTGTLLKLGELKLIVTAKHVLDDAKPVGLLHCYYNEDHILPLDRDHLLLNDLSKPDGQVIDADLCVLKLDPCDAELFAEDRFFDLSNASGYAPPMIGRYWGMIGYPGNANEFRPAYHEKVKNRPFLYWGKASGEAQATAARALPPFRLALSYRKKFGVSNGVRVILPNPNGMSGGPIFFYDFRSGESPKLAAISTDWKFGLKIVVGTSTAVLVEGIRRGWAELF